MLFVVILLIGTGWSLVKPSRAASNICERSVDVADDPRGQPRRRRDPCP